MAKRYIRLIFLQISLPDRRQKYPHIKIEFIQHDLQVSRNIAIRYLETLIKENLLVKHKFGKENYYLNERLAFLLKGNGEKED